ncbi:MAG: hypothetical protein ACI9M6_001556 [Hydrogenophaga sp.]|jgi:hypothetical protein
MATLQPLAVAMLLLCAIMNDLLECIFAFQQRPKKKTPRSDSRGFFLGG